MVDEQLDAQLVETIRGLPKVELHRHLEGSVRLSTLVEIARDYAFEMPEYDPEQLRPFVQMMPGQPRDAQHFLAKFATLRQFYRSPEIIYRITQEAIIDAAHDNIRYMELRFTPRALGTIIKATPHDVIGWVCEATRDTVAEYDIDVRLLASMNRHESLEFGAQVLSAAIDHAGQGIVGVDLAGREEGYPASPFAPLFHRAKAAGLGVTIHAGEWEGAHSVWDAVGNLFADRIGHGIRALEDPGMINVLAQRGIALEVCPSSNYDSGVVESLALHPLPVLSAVGVNATINTDDPLICNITLSEEIARMIAYTRFTLEDAKDAILRAAQAAFLPAHERAELVSRLKVEFGDPV